jgi:hypothetical protein
MNLYRTENIKYTTYTGDGQGRDGYIVMCNGGLHEMRKYNGPNTNKAFKLNPMARHNRHTAPICNRDPGTVDYTPDGMGRDTYIIRNYGLKANYRS